MPRPPGAPELAASLLVASLLAASLLAKPLLAEQLVPDRVPLLAEQLVPDRVPLLAERLVPDRVPPLLDEVSAEVLLRSQGIVLSAPKRKTAFTVPAPQRPGPKVMQLETVRLSAAFSRGADVRTASAVALEYGAAQDGRHVSPAPARRYRLLGRAWLCLRGLRLFAGLGSSALPRGLRLFAGLGSSALARGLRPLGSIYLRLRRLWRFARWSRWHRT